MNGPWRAESLTVCHYETDGRNTKYFHRYAIKNAVAQFFLRASSSDIPEQFRLVQEEFQQHAVPLKQGLKVLAMLLAIGEWRCKRRVVSFAYPSLTNEYEEGVDVGMFVDDRINDFMTDISYYYDFTEEYVTFVCACRIFISILWTVSLNARAFPDQNIPQPFPLHPRASVFVDRTKDKAPDSEEFICKPYVDCSGNWYGYDTYMDMAGNEDIDQHMDMCLQFVTSEDEATEMTLAGSGSDGMGDFEIINGVWKVNGCVQFCKRYVDRQNTLIRYMGRTLPSGVCGVYKSEGPELMLNGTFFVWRAERQPTLYGWC